MTGEPTRVLFVCSGNICRSPLAHVLLARRARARRLSIEVDSAGTLGIDDRPASKLMQRAASELGVDLSHHLSKGLTPELIAWADVVAVMEPGHAFAVHELSPEAPVEKVVQLGPLIGQPQIDDPYRSWTLGPYRAARDEIIRAVDALLESLGAGSAPG